MSDYDAIIVGAGHNGLTAAVVLQRAGLRTLCLEANTYTGGMSATVELIEGFRFEIAGSVRFPTAPKINAELGLDGLPTIEQLLRGATVGTAVFVVAAALSAALPDWFAWFGVAVSLLLFAAMRWLPPLAWLAAPASAAGRTLQISTSDCVASAMSASTQSRCFRSSTSRVLSPRIAALVSLVAR